MLKMEDGDRLEEPDVPLEVACLGVFLLLVIIPAALVMLLVARLAELV